LTSMIQAQMKIFWTQYFQSSAEHENSVSLQRIKLNQGWI
jgi:hypothetical protein